MQKVLEFLAKNPVGILATVENGVQPRCRPFQFMTEMDGRLWFCTNNQKAVYQQLHVDPAIEFCVCTPHSQWLRITGRAVFEDNHAVKEACMQNGLVHKLYETADNPIFVVFYIAGAHAVIADFSGNPPYEADLSTGAEA